MPRLFLYTLVVAALVLGAVWMADRPGAVSVTWLGWRLDTSVPVVLLALFVLLVAVQMILRVGRWFAALPRRWREARAERQRRTGYMALIDGLSAVAAGDGAKARRNAERADSLLRDPPLTMLLSAQAAQLAGDAESAKRHFSQMLDRKETAFLGLRGLLTQALKEGDRGAALGYARRAHAINPQADWLTATLFDLEAREGQWAAAQDTLAAGQRAGAFSGGEARRKKAVLLLERSRAAGLPSDALKLAYQAFQADPGFPAAAVHYAQALGRQGKLKKAIAVLVDCWRIEAHPDLARAWMDLVPEGGDPLERVRHAEKLLDCRPDAAAGHLLLGEVALEASLWGQARTHLTAAAETRPSARAYRLLARLEEAEGTDPGAARDWLAKAAEAPGEPVWSCRQCGTAAPSWSALCPACGGFDSLAWVDPVASHLPAVLADQAAAD